MKESLYQKVCSWENLLLAFRKAGKGKRGKAPAASFEYRLEDNLITLQTELREKTYRPGTYDSFYVHDPKRRLISAAPFRDRVVHHALCNVIEPIFERSFVSDSYANRVGKGNHRALDCAQSYAKRFKYVLPCDVRQFFPSIDHAILRGVLRDKIRDPEVMWLVDRILEGGKEIFTQEYAMIWFPGDSLFAAWRSRGLPIGNLTSQFWANCYLNTFDHFVKRELRCSGYIRYVDDMLFFGNDKRELWAWRQKIIDRLGRVRLKIHENRAQVRPVTEGFPFLGFLVFPHKRRLKPRKGIAFARKLRRLSRDYGNGKIGLDRISASILGWVNHTSYGNTFGLRKDVLSSVVFRKREGGSLGKDHAHFHEDL